MKKAKKSNSEKQICTCYGTNKSGKGNFLPAAKSFMRTSGTAKESIAARQGTNESYGKAVVKGMAKIKFVNAPYKGALSYAICISEPDHDMEPDVSEKIESKISALQESLEIAQRITAYLVMGLAAYMGIVIATVKVNL